MMNMIDVKDSQKDGFIKYVKLKFKTANHIRLGNHAENDDKV